jgi:hypothetical protein
MFQSEPSGEVDTAWDRNLRAFPFSLHPPPLPNKTTPIEFDNGIGVSKAEAAKHNLPRSIEVPWVHDKNGVRYLYTPSIALLGYG